MAEATAFKDTVSGILSNLSFLMVQEGADEASKAWNELVPVKEVPDLGKAPDLKDTTTTDSPQETHILGIKKSDALEFTGNYTLAQKNRLDTYKRKKGTKYAVWIGGKDNGDGTVTPTGEYGKTEFEGEMDYIIKGFKTDEVIETEITIAPSSPLIDTTATA